MRNKREINTFHVFYRISDNGFKSKIKPSYITKITCLENALTTFANKECKFHIFADSIVDETDKKIRPLTILDLVKEGLVNEKDNTLFVVEPLLTARLYLVSPTGEPLAGLFFEGEGGYSLLFVNSEMTGVFNAGGAVGFRFVFNQFYVEPELRCGYPYLFGIGLGAGLRF